MTLEGLGCERFGVISLVPFLFPFSLSFKKFACQNSGKISFPILFFKICYATILHETSR